MNTYHRSYMNQTKQKTNIKLVAIAIILVVTVMLGWNMFNTAKEGINNVSHTLETSNEGP